MTDTKFDSPATVSVVQPTTKYGLRALIALGVMEIVGGIAIWKAVSTVFERHGETWAISAIVVFLALGYDVMASIGALTEPRSETVREREVYSVEEAEAFFAEAKKDGLLK
uniref:Holin n=1 Tax=Caulobacter phage BL57 TaxID=3348355 RepID=A0AB74UMP8_9VIRU